MKFLGDSLPAFKYAINNNQIIIQPTGDPTFLHPDFKTQRAFNFLKFEHKPISIIPNNWKENALAFGWSWDDYNSSDMVERNAFPIYGNLIKWIQVRDKPEQTKQEGNFIFSEPDVTWEVNLIMIQPKKHFL